MDRAEAALAAVAPALVALAEADPGREVCGLIVAGSDGMAVAWSLPNRAAAPARAYALAPEAMLTALRRLDIEGKALLAVFHSHPEGGADLSRRDLEAALVDGEPLLQGVAQVVVSMSGGRVQLVRVHRWTDHQFGGTDIWTAVQAPSRLDL
jgi:proteasome lid subunit RPN8/RPN11